MWPWEHLAFGYVLLALLARARSTTVTDRQALVLVVATQLPDLIDKPLAWGAGVLPTGVSMAHSVLIAGPVAALAWALRPTVGRPLAVGWWSHVVADAVYPLIEGKPLALRAYFWPLVVSDTPEHAGLLVTVVRYLTGFLDLLATPRGLLYLGLEVTLLGTAIALWLADGRPGWPGNEESTA